MKNKKKKYIFLGIMMVLFIVLSSLMAFGKINYLDTLFHSFILEIRCDILTTIFTFITNLGGTTCLLAISVIILLFIKKKKYSLYILINLILAFITNECTKAMFMRTRPIGISLIDETGYSYTSGHSMVSFAFYGFILYLLIKKFNVKINKYILIIGTCLLIVLIGFSRVYLGVHYLSDVIGGFLLSSVYLILFIDVINKIEKK